MKCRAEAALLAALLLAAAARAQDAAPPPPTEPAPAAPTAPAAPRSGVDRLRPTGPVTVTADRAEWEKGGVMVYAGHVALVSDTLKLDGDRVELRQLGGGHYEAHITGAPAHLHHAGEPEGSGDAAQPVSAEARNLYYDSRTSIVEIKDGARLTRGEDSITGELIRYDVAARRIRASGGEGGQVRIVIQPPPPEKTEKKTP